MTDRVVALIDMDCFYCQVEDRLNPDLKGKPSAVVQYNDWKGGGIIAVNYEARSFGVTRNMRGDEAKEKCPDIVLVKVPEERGKADLTKYRNAGKEVIQVLKNQYSEAVIERASVDEAYLDLTSMVNAKMELQKTVTMNSEEIPNTFVIGHETSVNDWLKETFCTSNLKTDISLAIGASIVEEMRAEIFKQTSFRCSAGIAHNKVLAKLCAGLNKPNKQTILTQEQVPTLFKKVNIGKVRGLGGKLGDMITETFHVRTMADLSKINLLDLRRHLDEKTTTWVYNLSRGIDHEEVRERDLPKSIGCGKNFRGPEIIDTREKLQKWLGNLCEELSERLFKDQEENSRMAKTFHVNLSLENVGSSTRQGAFDTFDGGYAHVSKSGPLFSYAKEALSKQALQLISKFNDLPPSDPNWRPKIRNITMSASKFLENSQNNQSIQSFFKSVVAPAGMVEFSKPNEHTSNLRPEENYQEEAVEKLFDTEVVDDIEMIQCEKCICKISPFELPEHMDFHLAKELQDEFRKSEMANRTTTVPQASFTTSKSNSKKRKSNQSNDITESKKQKSISSFFIKE